MLFYYSKYLCGCVLLLMFIFMACAGYAYRVNARRATDDPKKRNFHPLAILFAPVTFPLLALSMIAIFILRAIAYGIFLVLFTIALFTARETELPAWLRQAILSIGERLLAANTFLIRLFFSPWEPQT